MTFIDLSHDFYQGMPGFRMKHPDTGEIIEYSAKIYPFLTHDQSRAYFSDNVSFEVTQVEFQSSVGTYLDSPYHRYPDLPNIGQLRLEDLILEGLVVDCRGKGEETQIELNEIDIDFSSIKDKAVLFNFGWSKYWGTDKYHKQPFIAERVIDNLIEARAKLVGVDTINIDGTSVKSRPAHSKLLRKQILILENLTNLDSLLNKSFRLFALPIKILGAAAFPVRVIAEITNQS